MESYISPTHAVLYYILSCTFVHSVPIAFAIPGYYFNPPLSIQSNHPFHPPNLVYHSPTFLLLHSVHLLILSVYRNPSGFTRFLFYLASLYSPHKIHPLTTWNRGRNRAHGCFHCWTARCILMPFKLRLAYRTLYVPNLCYPSTPFISTLFESYLPLASSSILAALCPVLYPPGIMASLFGWVGILCEFFTSSFHRRFGR